MTDLPAVGLHKMDTLIWRKFLAPDNFSAKLIEIYFFFVFFQNDVVAIKPSKKELLTKKSSKKLVTTSSKKLLPKKSTKSNVKRAKKSVTPTAAEETKDTETVVAYSSADNRESSARSVGDRFKF